MAAGVGTAGGNQVIEVPELGTVGLLIQTFELFAVPAVIPDQPVAPQANVTFLTFVGKTLFVPFNPISG